MAKLVLSMFMSLDGYVEGPDGFLPPPWSDEVEREWSGYSLARAGHLLYGRANFLFNKQFWSAAATDPTSPAAGISYADTMNRLPKTVVSRTLAGDPGWNARLAGPDLAGAVLRLKREAPQDVYCFGGARLANSLLALDLVDEMRLMVTPQMLGSGKRLFEPGRPALDFALIDAKRLDTGSVILHHARAAARQDPGR
jgi:dihydrofolate reductase